jgi:hypothetical protein
MNAKNKILIILFLIFSVANFSFGASSQQAIFMPNSNLAPLPYNGQIKISGNDQLNGGNAQNSPQALNFTLNVQPSTPLTLTLSTDKSQYQVGESAKYTISGTALPQNPSNYQTITATIYAVAYPPGRGGCANGCQVNFIYSNNSWSAYSNQFASSDVGNWTVYVKYNNTQSNSANYSVSTSTSLNPSGTISTDPQICQAPCDIKVSWTSSNISGSVVKIYKNNQFLWNQAPNTSGQGTDWGVPAGTYTYCIKGVNSDWTETNCLATATTIVNSSNQSTPAASLTINGVTSGSFKVGDSWTLRINSNIPNSVVQICATQNNTNLGCTNYGNTNSSGAWSLSGTFYSSVIGSWVEYAKVGSTNSNNINFTVSTQNNQSQPTLQVVPLSSLLNVGGSGTQLEAYYYPDGLSNPQTRITVTNNSNWSSSNTSVATVGNIASFFINKGYVTPISQGQAIITATYNSLIAQATVNVSSQQTIPKYKCSGSSCVRDDVNGTYTTSDCNNQCLVNIPKYKCSGSSCVRDDVNGTYTISNCNNQCSSPPPPPPPTTHLECNSSNQCVSIQGSGPNRCSTNSDCGFGGSQSSGSGGSQSSGSGGSQFKGVCETQQIGSSTASYCVNKACNPNIPGDCTSSCKDDSECQNPSSSNHLECYNNACVIISGSGQNKCGTIGPGCKKIREIIPFNPPSFNQFLKQTASIFFGWR